MQTAGKVVPEATPGEQVEKGLGKDGQAPGVGVMDWGVVSPRREQDWAAAP